MLNKSALALPRPGRNLKPRAAGFAMTEARDLC